MGDRTFSGEDVIRIYEDFLTSSEQEVVDFFFAAEPEESNLPSVANLLAFLETLLGLLSGFRIGVLAATFGSLTLAALNSAIAGLRSTNTILGNILEQEEVDA